jgi:cell division protein ZapA
MAQVNVTVNGRSYSIACDDGQEAHLVRLSRYVDQRVGELVAAVGQVGEARLLLMASLLLADQISDAYSEIKRMGGKTDDERAADEDSLAEALETLAKRIESIALRLDQA